MRTRGGRLLPEPGVRRRVRGGASTGRPPGCGPTSSWASGCSRRRLSARGRKDEEEYHQACPLVDEQPATSCRSTSSGSASCARDPAGLDRALGDGIDWSRYTAVGFTSTFEQNTAAFAMARAIKERYPGIVDLFGGANFDGTMGREYVRSLHFIDYAVIGEGDKVLPQIVNRLAQGEEPLGCQASRPPRRQACRERLGAARRRHELRSRSRLRRVLRHAFPAGIGEGPGQERRRPPPFRDLARLLVGREAALHVLRPQQQRHEVPRQGAGGSGRPTGADVRASTRSSTSRPSTTSSTTSTSSSSACLCRRSTTTTGSSMRSSRTSARASSGRWRGQGSSASSRGSRASTPTSSP